MASQYTRSGTRRSGDDYQDIVALDAVVSMLEQPEQCNWVRVEADDAGYLDDIVIQKSSGELVVKQVKYSTNSSADDDAWTWQHLLKQEKGARGKLKPSLLQRWAKSLSDLQAAHTVAEAAVFTNRRASVDLQSCLAPARHVDIDRVSDAETLDAIIGQLNGDTAARRFFALFRFEMAQPDLESMEDQVRRRFYRLGTEEIGLLDINKQLHKWVRIRNEPAPDGAITLEHARLAARWYQLKSLPQDLRVPADYVLPSQSFHDQTVRDIRSSNQGCLVVTGSPGAGKSTYLSYLYQSLASSGQACVRHHYYLSQYDRGDERYNSQRVAESLMSDIRYSYPSALGALKNDNPNPSDLYKWIETCAKYFAEREETLVVILDGLDHVGREKGSAQELDDLLRHILPPPQGVFVVVGTQLLDGPMLPDRLGQAAPVSGWRAVPYLELSAVADWLEQHSDAIETTGDADRDANIRYQLAEVLHRKSGGHPLHMLYSFRTLSEQRTGITLDSVDVLPDCPHHDIASYYQRLWRSLSKHSQEILHLIAACPFPWPPDGISECLDPTGQRPLDYARARRQVMHLLSETALGLQPFHSSLLVFVKGLSEHSEIAARYKQRALDWLRGAAPEYWRWAYEWRLLADLGDAEPLLEAPNREWAVASIAMARPYSEISSILEVSSWTSLQSGDLGRFVRTGLLRDYMYSAHDYRSHILEELTFPQMVLCEDQTLPLRLQASLERISNAECCALAE